MLKFLGSSFFALCACIVLISDFTDGGDSEADRPRTSPRRASAPPVSASTHASIPTPSTASPPTAKEKAPAEVSLPPITYERLTDSTIVADFPIVDGETYAEAGRRLTEYGKELCLSYADVAILNVVNAESGKSLGRIDLPLTSFLDFHIGDPTDRMMAAEMWKTNAPMMVQRVFEPW